MATNCPSFTISGSNITRTSGPEWYNNPKVDVLFPTRATVVTVTGINNCTGLDLLYCPNDCSPSSSSVNVIACHTFIAPSGTVYSSSGIITDVIPNSMGCDSTITIDLTIMKSAFLR